MEDHPGTLIAGKYELREIAGKGGMATVWRAICRGAEGFARPVAVKRVLPSLMANSEFSAMFVEEARVGSKLQHPHVVQIEDFGEDREGGYYLVMEWVEGLDLGRYLRAHHARGAHAPWPLVTAICIEALRGLRAAHERTAGAVIHRDITPQNILVGASGIAKLTDFGLARAMDRARMTLPDTVKGKVSYLSPELTRGDGPSVRSDIYGAGIVLWESLAGRPLFEGKTDLEVLIKVRDAEIPPLASFRPDLPAALCDAVHVALAKSPAQRFASAYELTRTLARILRTIPEDTDEKVIGESIARARRWLAGA